MNGWFLELWLFPFSCHQVLYKRANYFQQWHNRCDKTEMCYTFKIRCGFPMYHDLMIEIQMQLAFESFTWKLKSWNFLCIEWKWIQWKDSLIWIFTCTHNNRDMHWSKYNDWGITRCYLYYLMFCMHHCHFHQWSYNDHFNV